MTEIVEKAGRFLKAKGELGQGFFVLDEREGGQFSLTFDEWDLLVPAVKRLRKRMRQ